MTCVLAIDQGPPHRQRLPREPTLDDLDRARATLKADPPDVVVALGGGLDAVTQVIEPYVCTRSSPMTDALCRAAIPQGLHALKAVALTSLAGGKALANAGLGAVHGLAGVIGGVTGVPHGAICGALLAPVLAANRAAVPDASGARARLDRVGEQVSAVFGTAGGMAAWARGHGLRGLCELGVTPDMRAEIAAKSQCASSMKANPVDLSLAAVVVILEANG